MEGKFTNFMLKKFEEQFDGAVRREDQQSFVVEFNKAEGKEHSFYVY